jgi:diguanylate cyclase (GGDEF)-like protein
MDHQPSWLCPTLEHRERFLDMQERVHNARLVTMAVAVVVIVACVGRVGWELPVFGCVMLSIVILGGLHIERRRRPELWVFITTVLNIQIWVTFAAIAIGGPRTPFPCALAAPVLMVGTRFSRRGIAVGAPTSFLLVLICTVAVDPGYAVRHPASVIVPLGLVVITAAYLLPVVASDVSHRVDSTKDELTGLLNRRALRLRLDEIVEQVEENHAPVSAIVVDIDYFKLVNDEHGHAAGDEVLREIARTLRLRLRTFELLYRIGGDEFLLLLPGASASDAFRLAESLHEAISAARSSGCDVTCSCGVATARTASEVIPLIQDADEALYRAKRLGRDRVEMHERQAARAA